MHAFLRNHCCQCIVILDGKNLITRLETELLQGELLVELERYEEAEHHFLHASRMCPVRFVPLHQLYQLYKNTGCEQKARQMGETILNKPVKVESVVIRSIRNNVRKDFYL